MRQQTILISVTAYAAAKCKEEVKTMAKKSEKRNQKGQTTNRNDTFMDKAENTNRKSHGSGSQTHENNAYTNRNDANDCK